MQKYTIDAQNKKIGRVASEAAKILIGKNTVTFARNTIPNVEVEVINTSKADISMQKMAQPLHARYSGYPSGIKIDTVASVITKKGHKEVFRQAIYGMLPTNKLRAKMIKHLKISD